MRITLTNERNESATINLAPGENAFLTIDGAELPAGASLYVGPDGDTIGIGAVDPDVAWWEYATPLPITEV